MTNANTLKQLSACLIATDRFHAIENFIKKYPDNIDLRYYHGLAEARQGHIKEALQEFKTVLQRKPEHEMAKRLTFELLIYEASKYVKDNNWKEMSIYLTDALEIVSEFPEMQKRLSGFKNALPISLIKADRREEASKIWEGELWRDPSNHVLVHSLALLYYWWAIHEEEDYKNQLEGKKEQNEASSKEPLGNIYVSQNGTLIENDDEKSNIAHIDGLWNKTIVYWSLLLNMEKFWLWWKQEKEDVWGVKINQEDIKGIRNQLHHNKLNNLFYNYKDYYKQASKNKDALRHDYYLALIGMERKVSRSWEKALQLAKDQLKIQIGNKVKRFELVRAIQESLGSSICFGTEKDCKEKNCIWGPDCLTNRNQDVCLNFPAGYLFFENQGTLLDVYYLTKVLHKQNPKDNKLAQLRIFFSPKRLARLYGLLEEGHNPQKILEDFEKLSQETRKSVEGIYLYILALQKTGKEFFSQGDFEKAFSNWDKVNETINAKGLQKRIQDQFFSDFFLSFKKEFEELIITTCEAESKKLKKQNKVNKAISILEKGQKLTNSKTLKEPLAIFYVEQGYEKINKEKFDQARNNFKKALTILKGHKGAKEGMALAYNNEASKKRNIDTALPLYKKALEYNPNNNVIRNNLAGAYNGKAVDLLNSISPYSYTIQEDVDTAIELLEEGLGILNPAFKSLGKMGIMAATMIPDLYKAKGNEMLQTMLRNLLQAYEIRDKLPTRF